MKGIISLTSVDNGLKRKQKVRMWSQGRRETFQETGQWEEKGRLTVIYSKNTEHWKQECSDKHEGHNPYP